MRVDSATLGTILWPAFLGAAAADGLLFTLIDPSHIGWLGRELSLSPLGYYTLGFFLFWVLFALCSGLTLWLHEAVDLESRPERHQA